MKVEIRINFIVFIPSNIGDIKVIIYIFSIEYNFISPNIVFTNSHKILHSKKHVLQNQ